MKDVPNQSDRAEAEPNRAPHPPQDITRTQPQRSELHLLTALLSGIEPLTRTHFLQAVVPALRVFPAEVVSGEVGLSISYCAKIRAGRCTPGRKHWETFRRYLWSHANDVRARQT